MGRFLWAGRGYCAILPDFVFMLTQVFFYQQKIKG